MIQGEETWDLNPRSPAPETNKQAPECIIQTPYLYRQLCLNLDIAVFHHSAALIHYTAFSPVHIIRRIIADVGAHLRDLSVCG